MWENLLNILKYDEFQPLIFNSGFFLFFFLFALVLNKAFVNFRRLRLLFLTILSVYFYYKSSGFYFFLVIISTLIDYLAALGLERTEKKPGRMTILVLSLVTNFGMLGYFKYTNFLIESFNSVFSGNFETADIFLPVGISFFTFQSLSYTIDVYRKNLKAEKNFLDLLFFVTFFPQLVAGPIVRASDFLPQIRQQPFISKDEIGRAFLLIIFGLIKKAVIADYISINFVDRVFSDPLRFTGLENLAAVYMYALQIYCDFSGYSDMAIGLALLMGFRIPINFNVPYTAASITDFWRRWHISLSSWLRDYLYISLGGNRKGKGRTYFNLIITMLLGGLWHGAAWKFILWGGIHGMALAVEKSLGLDKLVQKNKVYKFIGTIITFHIVCFCWIFFRANDWTSAINMIQQIFVFFKGGILMQFLEAYMLAIVLFLLGMGAHFLPERFDNFVSRKFYSMNDYLKAFVLAIVILIVFQFQTSDVKPFIYFQF